MKKFYRYIESYKLHIVVFELSNLDIYVKKKKKKILAKILLWNILIKFYAVKITNDKGHYSGHLSSYLSLINLMNSFFPVDFTKYFKYLKKNDEFTISNAFVLHDVSCYTFFLFSLFFCSIITFIT